MSWKAEANKIYEQQMVETALARLAERVDLRGLPFSEDELKTLAKRAREALHLQEKKVERLARYKAHLAKSHGSDVVARIAAALEEINNEIGYEEK